MSRPKVLITVPTGNGWVHRTVMIAFTKMHMNPAGCEVDGMVTEIRPLESNRHYLRKEFLDGPWDYWLSMDADNAPRNCNPLELAHLGLDIVGCPTPVWNNRKPGEILPVYLNAFDVADPGLEGYKVHYPQIGLQEVDAIGTGCFLVSRKVMEALEAPFLRTWKPDGMQDLGGDLAFCQRAKAAGFKIWAHFEYLCDHYKELELEEVAHAFLSCKRGST